MQKRLNLKLKTLVDLQIRLADPVTSKNALLVHTYSI
jgi:hypothetical protein